MTYKYAQCFVVGLRVLEDYVFETLVNESFFLLLNSKFAGMLCIGTVHVSSLYVLLKFLSTLHSNIVKHLSALTHLPLSLTHFLGRREHGYFMIFLDPAPRAPHVCLDPCFQLIYTRS